jgi:hypothetical protein
MVEAANPGDRAFDAHSKSGVRNPAVFSQIEIPLERRLGQAMLVDPLKE